LADSTTFDHENFAGIPGAAHGTPIAISRLPMQLLRKVVSLAVPSSVALIAFLHAHALGSLIDATIMPASSVAPFAEARAAAMTPTPNRSAHPILDRNPFDHVTGPLRVGGATAANTTDPTIDDPLLAPPCEGVRATIAVQGNDPDGSLAAFDARGQRLLRRRGGEIFDMRVVYVAEDRVWLSHNNTRAICQTQVFGAPPPSPSPQAAGDAGLKQSALEKEVTSKIAKTGPNEYQIDRGAVDRILDAQAELMKTPLVPEKEGDRVVGFRMTKIRSGSVLSALGLENNDRLVSLNGVEVTSTERMIEAYAKLRTGTVDRFTIHVVRNGKPTNLDYLIR
jgi:general secretion pathway protein C